MRDGGEELGGAPLQEQDVVAFGDVQQLADSGGGLVQHGVELLAAVAAFGDAEALALVVDEGLGGRLQHLERQHAGTGGEVENARLGHELRQV